MSSTVSEGPSGYTTNAGETLQSIAAQLWGDSSLWYKLAEANPGLAPGALAAGTSLRIPGGVIGNHHSADTFKPYDPAEAIGNTSPNTPKPPKKNNCGVFGQILIAVVAIAVTAWLTGPLSSAIGKFLAGGAVKAGSAAAIAGGAIGGGLAGAAGSVVSQGFGIATGIQQGGFNWGAVAMAGISGAISGGIGAWGEGARAAKEALGAGEKLGTMNKIGHFLGRAGVTSGAVRGLVSNVLGQGIGIATRLQSKFDFAGAAASAVGGGVNAEIEGSGLGGHLARAGADGLASAATRSLITGTSFGDNIIAALPGVIGRTIGGMVAEGIAGSGRMSSRTEKSYGVEGEENAQSSASNGARSTEQDASSEEIVVTAKRKVSFDPGFRLGPKDRYDEPSGFERFVAKLTPWKDRVDRIDRMKALIDARDYNTIIAENFKITTEGNATSNWDGSVSRDDAKSLADDALKELFNTRTGHRILITIAS